MTKRMNVMIRIIDFKNRKSFKKSGFFDPLCMKSLQHHGCLLFYRSTHRKNLLMMYGNWERTGQKLSSYITHFHTNKPCDLTSWFLSFGLNGGYLLHLLKLHMKWYPRWNRCKWSTSLKVECLPIARISFINPVFQSLFIVTHRDRSFVPLTVTMEAMEGT